VHGLRRNNHWGTSVGGSDRMKLTALDIRHGESADLMNQQRCQVLNRRGTAALPGLAPGLCRDRQWPCVALGADTGCTLGSARRAATGPAPSWRMVDYRGRLLLEDDTCTSSSFQGVMAA